MIFLIVLTLFFSSEKSLVADESIAQYPVDVSFLVADLKYSQEEGVKICEVQNGTMSTFDGDIFCHGGRGTIAPGVVKWMESFHKNIWAIGRSIVEYRLRIEARDSKSWIFKGTISGVQSDKRFKSNAKKEPEDPKKISNYNSFLFFKIPKKSERIKLLNEFPGAILIDNVTYPFWADKYLMSLLFNKHPLLQNAKPRWNLYKKKYTPQLANIIANELQCDRFVIKPRSECLGRGVILVHKEDLNTTLKIILKKNRRLKKYLDPSHRYWYFNEDDSFIVEQFVQSDPLLVPHLNNKVYDPTMRVAYLLKYDEQKIEIEFLGANWFMPSHSLDQPGTLNQKHKGYNEIPYYTLVDPEYLSEIREKLDEIIRTLYWQMLIHNQQGH